jgi:very-short-patch-repair endonuclease
MQCPRCGEVFKTASQKSRHKAKNNCTDCKSPNSTCSHTHAPIDSENRNIESEDRNNESEDRNIESEDRNIESEDRNNESEVEVMATSHASTFTEILTKCRKVTLEAKEVYSVYDAIMMACGTSSRHVFTCYSRMMKLHHLPAHQTHQFPGRGQRLTPVASESQCFDIVRLILGSSRLPLDHRRAILGDVGYVPVKTYVEVEIHNNVMKALSHEDIILQYDVGVYRVDMYFPKYRIAVECDENGHPYYDGETEKSRQEYITQKLGCTWIRYNPYDENFDVFRLINTILTQMKAFSSH